MDDGHKMTQSYTHRKKFESTVLYVYLQSVEAWVVGEQRPDKPEQQAGSIDNERIQKSITTTGTMSWYKVKRTQNFV